MVCILLYLVLAPFFSDFVKIRLLMDFFLSAIFLSGVYAVSENKRNTRIALLLALPMFISIWLSHVVKIPNIDLMIHVFGMPFLLFMIVAILTFIFKTHQVTRDVIAASIVVYLLIGILWGFIYTALNFIEPGSFSYNESGNANQSSIFAYFSLVTLTTLGYGDVAPLTSRARAFAVAEAVIGQMYIAILIARLVGIHIAQQMSGKNKKDK